MIVAGVVYFMISVSYFLDGFAYHTSLAWVVLGLSVVYAEVFGAHPRFKSFTLGGLLGCVIPDLLTHVFRVYWEFAHSWGLFFAALVAYIFYETYQFLHTFYNLGYSRFLRFRLLSHQNLKFWLKLGVLFFWMVHLVLDNGLHLSAVWSL
ncbi:MAG: hypothetical protein ABH851_04900 [Methanobacteriota archaeon]